MTGGNLSFDLNQGLMIKNISTYTSFSPNYNFTLSPKVHTEVGFSQNKGWFSLVMILLSIGLKLT